MPTRIPVPPDPATLHAIASMTGGKFFNARSADTLESAYKQLGSKLGRVPGTREATNEIVFLAALAAHRGVDPLGALGPAPSVARPRNHARRASVEHLERTAAQESAATPI